MSAAAAPRAVFFGELLLRLDTRAFHRIVQADELIARFTGAEANAAVMLAGLGIPSNVVSRVPDGELGQACVNQLRRYGVDTSRVLRGGERLGLLYVEAGFGARPTRVLYDRGHTGFSTLEPGSLDWQEILRGASWLHASGTALAVGAPPRIAALEGFRCARRLGARTSLDCNYRALLGSRDEMRADLGEILPLVSLLVGSFADASLLLGEPEAPNLPDRAVLPDAAIELARRLGSLLGERYGIAAAAFSVRQERPDRSSGFTGYLWDGRNARSSRTYESAVLDRIGSGDAYTAGLIHGFLVGADAASALERAAAASCLKLTIPGDFALVTLEEIDRLVAGVSGGILR